MRRFSMIVILLALEWMASQAQQPVNDYGRNNAVYYEIFGPGLFFGSLNYDRLFRISQNQGISLRIGIAYYGGPFVIPEANYLMGNGVHYAEIGIGTSTFFLLTEEGGPDIYIRAGYRLQGKNGFHLRVAPVISTTKGSLAGDLLVLPAVSLGYCY